MTNWKTTLAGLSTILIAVGNAIHAYLAGQPVDVASLVAALTAGVGLIAAKDAPAAPKVAGGTIGSIGPTGGAAAALALLFLAGTGCSAVQKVDNSLKGDAFSVTSGGQTVSGKVSSDGSFCFDVAEPIQIGPATCSHICIGPTTQICTAPAIAGSATSTLTVKSGP